ncbi:hypothetical protein CHU32_07390 [Superficieibacter electus]|uniref:YcxB-like protein domain-containing protein n=1 Tax=Superficieibacter electus TaxID=2022662 RepID=A0A2P5GSC4_9ENTR|nr:hypothetical protein [Superficieibacter electus]POP46733.1 hypothetical protein CHU33_04435 [Superficieibacter electus]POP49471.1 hypothetical protein CHU32_07390 [Superficieibacter electus]
MNRELVRFNPHGCRNSIGDSIIVDYDLASFTGLIKNFTQFLKKYYKVYRIYPRVVTLPCISIAIALVMACISSVFPLVSWIKILSAISYVAVMVFVAATIGIQVNLWIWLFGFREMARALYRADFSQPARYTFYQEGIVFTDPWQYGALSWDDFYIIQRTDEFLAFIFCPKNTPKGKITAGYLPILIPAKALDKHAELFIFLAENAGVDFDFIYKDNSTHQRK